MNLSAQEERFCNEYFIDYNATQAALRAGYSQKAAGKIASKLLENEAVQKFMRERREELSSKLQITQEKVLHELSLIAFSNVQDLFDENGNLLEFEKLDSETAAAVASFEFYDKKKTVVGKPGHVVKKKVRFHNKLDALNKLAKFLGMFPKK